MFTRPDHIHPGTPEATAYFATKRASRQYENIRRDVVEFDAKDAKGRIHGYSVAYAAKTYARIDGDTHDWLVDDENLGTWFTVCPHAMKDGKTFGACQPEKHFRTMAEAEAAGAAMIERARKAAAKKK